MADGTYRPSFSLPALDADRIPTPSPLREDEGFSETASEAAEDTKPMHLDRQSNNSAWNWLLSLDDSQRAELAHRLLLSLPNQAISRIVRDANARLHFDPVDKLPTEIVFQVFAYLEPKSLLNASIVSQSWQSRACEPRLWRSLFRLEGWTYNSEKISQFEASSRDLLATLRKNPSGAQGRRTSRSPKRLRAEATRIWVEKGSLQMPQELSVLRHRSTTRALDAGDVDMPDADDLASSEEMEQDSVDELLVPPRPYCPLLKPPELLGRTAEQPRVDWQYLYNQRRRLEQNWTNGRFTNFRLPHPDHPREAHTQCIYTVQFSANYLVSGSRDKTVRVWDLRTQRLKYPPLKGHEGSVLCLQFDEKQGVIISGGSDSHVIVWDLKTGTKYKKIPSAHSESVLNLRFDDRYLVTCSKDKTIKLWNRKHDLMPTDADYPATNTSRNASYPRYIVNAQDYAHDLHKPNVKPLEDYSLLMKFEGHGAAVNAIQIQNNQIVSASGDRKIMLWDIKTGNLIRTFTGHSKGIACVQYDGRRIISGSSDNSVRIFDSSTAAEVAVLEGHRNLVRTVQAEFGDVTGDEAEQEAQAREIDRNMVLQRRQQRRFFPQMALWPQRNFVYGAKLPPGGGGNRWSKIISGSYDETVIIWRRDREGSWIVARELRQEDAMRSSTSTRGARSTAHVQNEHLLGPLATASLPPAQPHQLQGPQPPASGAASQAATNEGDVSQDEGNTAPPTAPPPPQATPYSQVHLLNPSPMGPAQPTVTNAYAQPLFAGQPQGSHQSAPFPAHQHPHHPHYQYQVQQALHNQPPPHPNQANRDADGPGASRVFKLQFDARRIVCCSQQTVIVGWDFANGDTDIIEASQFFGEPS